MYKHDQAGLLYHTLLARELLLSQVIGHSDAEYSADEAAAKHPYKFDIACRQGCPSKVCLVRDKSCPPAGRSAYTPVVILMQSNNPTHQSESHALLHHDVKCLVVLLHVVPGSATPDKQ